MKRLARRILSFRLGGEQGGIAILMVLAFMVLAVPLSLAAVNLADQLALSSRAHDSRLVSHYSAGAGAEYVLWQILNDPSFDEGLSQEDPSQETTVEVNEETVTVTITKIFSEEDLQGQAVVVSKIVTPTTAPVDTPTTFTYTITIENEGSDTVRIKQICDYLPPYFSYVSGSTGGDFTWSDPTIDPDAGESHGVDCAQLKWDFAPKVDVGAGETKTLTFDATATLPDGTYYNQARVRYDPWWSSHYFYIFTPYTAEVTVGAGTPKYGFDMKLLVSKEADPPQAPPGVETEVTYTITLENVSSSTLYVCKIEDLLPPDYTYVAGSSADYPDNIASFDPSISQDPHRERWLLTWENGDQTPLTSIPGGETKTQVFRAMVTPEPGVNYYNEVSVVWSDQETGTGGQTTYGGTGESSSLSAPPLYDVASVAPDGSILARIVFWELDGEIEIISWQQY